jgi:diacylglycerol O-acyltransferase
MKRTAMSMPDRVFLSFDTETVFTHMSLISIFRIRDTTNGFVADLVARLRAADTVVEPFNYRAPARWPRRRWDVLDRGDIDLGHHLIHSALPAPGGPRQLQSAIARVHSRPLDPTKPLWETHVLEGMADGRFAICHKVHHALMDGVALMDQFCRMVSSDPLDRDLRPVWAIPLGRSAAPAIPGRVLGTARELAGGARRFAAEARHPTDPALAVPLTGPRSRLLNGRVSRQRSWATTEFDVARMRALAERADASINEIFLAALSGALRRYLIERDELPERGLIAGVPVASRSDTGDPRHNAGGMILVNLFTDLTDPVDRLRGVKRSSALAKQHLDSLSAPAADLYAVLTFGPFMLQELTHLSGRVRAPFNVTVSNVPGPRAQRYLLGAALDGLFGAANLGHGQRLNMTVVSAGGRIGVGCTGCGDALADIDRLADHLGDAVAELEAVEV